MVATMAVSCTTAYDSYGNPRPVVDPGTAVLGAAAAGLAGYAIGNSRSHRHYRDYDYGHRSYTSYRPVHRHHRHHAPRAYYY